jgi:hypothetical protein
MSYLEPIRINKISLENFQTIREKIEIPIRPLTFLFGPNSSGKSSILDALKLFKAVFKDGDITIGDYFRRWAHRPKQTEISGQSRIEKMTIEIEFSAWEFLIGGRHFLGLTESLPNEYWTPTGLKDILSETEGPYHAKIELIPSNFQSSDDGYVSLSSLAHVDITISANGLKLIRLFLDDDEDNPQVEFYPKAFGSMFVELATRHDVDINSPNIFKISCYSPVYGNGLEVYGLGNNEPYDRDLFAIANHIFRCFSEADFLPNIVSADRSTIPNHLLTCVFGGDAYVQGIPARFLNSPIDSVESIREMSSGTILEICKSKFKEIQSLNEIEKQIDINFESLHNFVNRSLSQHLFLDQGYQISFDICEIRQPENGSLPDTFAALIVSYLIDNAGRKLTFQDVGTGISCVVPVISALHKLHSFIQQPELHLHPALQSALGDILVEQVNRENPGRYFIETHSDYLLLRCLRRIRETSNGKYSAESKLRLKPEDISILYFEPQTDGVTSIKKIRASTQGDFLDRWPRGFFEERGKDLFDE